jgi:integrase
MSVVPIRKTAATAKTKVVEATQKSVDALPLNSGTWRVDGIPGLYLRCRAQSKSFFLQRRVSGELVNKTLGELSVKAAKSKAMAEWNRMKPKPAADGTATLETAIEQYLDAKRLAEITKKLARYNTKRYLAPWKDRSLEDIGNDRAGIRALQQRITRDHGTATSNQVVRLLAAVYRWSADVNEDLPPWSRKAAEIHAIKARDWAYSPQELSAWWHAIETTNDRKEIHKGVNALGPVKKMWWLTALLTGARKGSIEALKWTDADLARKVIKFAVTKGNRPYTVPLSDSLAALLAQYQENPSVPPSEWVFPSPVIDGGHLVDVKNPNEGVGPAHRLRHSFRTTLAELGASPDQARMLMGHSMGGDVSRGYISTPLVVESLRPITNAVSEHYIRIIGQF